ncbi:hypothetical protein M3Y99_01428500 [Aphelenchoides fujianensis]|nr:hypothetical protein M3Y99_01428500 [Aphelenchoides fujianensis]
MHRSLLVLFVLLSTSISFAKVYNILHCTVKDDMIRNCNGTWTPITPEHERALDDYMDNLAAYYRQQYPLPNAANDAPQDPIPQPVYPQLCEVCP